MVNQSSDFFLLQGHLAGFKIFKTILSLAPIWSCERFKNKKKPARHLHLFFLKKVAMQQVQLIEAARIVISMISRQTQK